MHRCRWASFVSPAYAFCRGMAVSKSAKWIFSAKCRLAVSAANLNDCCDAPLSLGFLRQPSLRVLLRHGGVEIGKMDFLGKV
jgi:hypothetical protein